MTTGTRSLNVIFYTPTDDVGRSYAEQRDALAAQIEAGKDAGKLTTEAENAAWMIVLALNACVATKHREARESVLRLLRADMDHTNGSQ